MLVLGYPNTTKARRPSITVPPFHTGHLGFVPDTPARVSLVASPASRRHCEVIVTPFAQDVRYLARVAVAMRDETGVVSRLIDAVAALDMNIEVQESSSINLLHHHFVTLLVDLSEASMSDSAEFSSPSSIPETPPAVKRLYRGYESLFPVHDLRFVRLFESIVAHCGDVIVWKEISGEYFPDINIRPYSDRPLSTFEVKPLVKGARKLQVQIDLPQDITHRLKRALGPSEEFEYLLVSDTATRTLHAFFLHPHLASNLFHVGFLHDDVPGALAAILGLLRRADFNILTSLVRKQEKGRSIWEAVLEYKGSDEMPSRESRPSPSAVGATEIEWIGERIAASHTNGHHESVDYDIVLTPPKYPFRKEDAPPKPIPLARWLEPTQTAGRAKQGNRLDQLIGRQLTELPKRSLDPRVRRKNEELLRLIERRSSETRSRVFLSYPHHARRYAKRIQDRLANRYRIELSDEPTGEVIVDEVIHKIESSDYFIGIWHHDGNATRQNRTRDISPWMLFEYGIARAAAKPAIVVHSDKLHSDVWQRIDLGVSTPEYSHRTFDKTVDTIWEYCERYFH